LPTFQTFNSILIIPSAFNMKTFTISLLISLMLFSGISFSQTWNDVNSTGTTFILYGMSFPPGQNTIGYACGMQYTYDAPGVIVKTTDGGNNWAQIWPVSGEIDGIQGIWFTSDLVGFACGWNNYFIKTTDGGATWTPVTVGSNVWYYVDVVFWDANNGVAAANMNNPGDQAVFITSNGGTTWVPASSGVATNEIMGLAYADQNTVFAVGTGAHVFRSTDGGHNWTTQSTLSALLFGVDFASSTFGVVGGEEKMFATNNGGSSWTTYVTGYENFYATKAFANGTAYVGGTDEDIYFTSDFGQTWTIDHSGGSSSLYRIRFTDNNTGFACGSGGVILKKEPVLNADFTSNITTVCAGGNVNFYDNSTGDIDSWAWAFEGGTPATSSAPDPVVTYSTPGTYNVELTVTSGAYNSTELKTDFITVITAPAQPNMPAGPSSVCGDGTYTYTTQSVPDATSYFWTVNPTSAGTIVGNSITGTFLASNTWEGTFNIKVRAENACGNGPWSPDFTGELWHNPIAYSFVGDGAFCEGEPGFEIILDGSETGVNYELFRDDVTTGIVVAGTGDSISFGLFTQLGLYSAVGSTDHCTQAMLGQVYVHQQSLPGQAATPEGPEFLCNNLTSVYTTTGASGADSYSWTLTPAEAGTISPTGNSISIAWNNSFSGTANLSVLGTNDCGDGIPSQELAITVFLTPTPSVVGNSLVCDNETEEYSTANSGSAIYTWEVSGGNIIAGEGTPVISVLWGNPGSGSVSVYEESMHGCYATSDTLEVTIDDCIGISEEKADAVRIYPNPATDKLQVGNLKEATIRIYNLLGVEEMSFYHASGIYAIDVSSFDNGIYFVKVEQESGYSGFYFIKL
jgi:photosystem II stability/assembly factor-like uncharacterized protein